MYKAHRRELFGIFRFHSNVEPPAMAAFRPAGSSMPSANPGGLVDTVFSHGEDVRKVVRSFNLQKVTTVNLSPLALTISKELVGNGRPLRVDLAPSWRSSTGDSGTLDKRCLVMISGTMRSLSNISPDSKNWDTIQSNLMQISLLSPDGHTTSRRASLRIPRSKGFSCIPGPSATDHAGKYDYSRASESADDDT